MNLPLLLAVYPNRYHLCLGYGDCNSRDDTKKSIQIDTSQIATSLPLFGTLYIGVCGEMGH